MAATSLYDAAAAAATVAATCACPPRADGVEYSHFVGERFGDCVYTNVEYWSFYIGLLSVGISLITMAPQVGNARLYTTFSLGAANIETNSY
jgi:hypothetical protein